LLVEQGVEMGRPSRIDVTARLEGGRVRAVSIAGRCVPVMRGEIELGDRQR
jgi:trans-2,3-dihydro-3-hydroxyanthranilate isomerase